MSDFLPKGHVVPEDVGGYMKLKKGDNHIRVLSDAIVGWEYWTTDRKPIRLRERPVHTPDNIALDDNGMPRVKYFWAFVVWNYDVEAVQILEITQKTIREPLLAYLGNKKWGDLKGYDLTITKTGDTKLDTEYSVIADPHSDIGDVITMARENKFINLEALFDGADPFQQGVSTKPTEKRKEVAYPTDMNPDDIPF